MAMHAILEATAKARFGRSINSRSTISAQAMGLKVGELVDFYKDPDSKDLPGWIGPATVVNFMNQARGMVTVEFE